jgi:hypothetical protein
MSYKFNFVLDIDSQSKLALIVIRKKYTPESFRVNIQKGGKIVKEDRVVRVGPTRMAIFFYCWKHSQTS